MTMHSSALALAQLAAELAAGRRPTFKYRRKALGRSIQTSPQCGVLYDEVRGSQSVEAVVDGTEFSEMSTSRPRTWHGVTGRANRSSEAIDVLILRSLGWPDVSSTIASVLPQIAGMDCVLHICLDHASTGTFPEDERIVVHTSGDDLGAGSARNQALERCDGAHVLVLDSTDTLLPRALKHLRTALSFDQAEAAYGMVIKSNGLITSAFPFEAERIGRMDYLAAAALWRRSTLLELGGWWSDPSSDGREVRDLWWRHGAKGGTAILVPRPLVRQGSLQVLRP
jgi:hypothetical protein